MHKIQIVAIKFVPRLAGTQFKLLFQPSLVTELKLITDKPNN